MTSVTHKRKSKTWINSKNASSDICYSGICSTIKNRISKFGLLYIDSQFYYVTTEAATGVVLWEKVFLQKFRKFHRKTPVPEKHSKFYTGFPHLFWMRFSWKEIALQFTRGQFFKQTKSKLSKIWYGISFLFSSKNMGHLTKGNKEFWNAKCIQSKNQELGS